MSSEKKIRKTIIAKLTDEQAETVERVIAESGKKRSIYLRDLVARDCNKKGFSWPEDEYQHGGNRVRACPECDSYRIEDVYGEWKCMDCGWEIDFDPSD